MPKPKACLNKRILIQLLYLLLSHEVACSQGLHERLYIQTDRNYYAKGETIYFKGYILPGNDTIASTNLFVELWDTSFIKLAAICVPVLGATSVGSLTIPKDIRTNQVFLRAYTDITPFQQLPFQFIKPVLGISAGKLIQEADPNIPGNPVFFPEGGKLVYNAYNHVAFKGPLNFSGTIRTNNGEQVAMITTVYNGLGVFRFRPVKGKTYFCHWKINGKDSVLALPIPVENGVALHVSQRDDSLFFDIDNGRNMSLNIQKPRVQLMTNDKIVYIIDLTMNGNANFSYFIPLRAFQTGVAELRVLDNENNILARRPFFIPGKRFDRHTGIEIVQKDLAKRGNNLFRINFRDTSVRYVSVSVTDAVYNDGSKGLGLRSTLLPPGISPISSKTHADRYTELDLALLTMDDKPGEGIIKNDSLKTATSQYLQLSGIVKKGKKLLANMEVLLMVRSDYAGKNLYKVVTDEQGKFVMDGLILYGDAFIQCRLPGNADDELSCELRLKLPVVTEDSGFFNAFKQKTRSMASTGAMPVVAATPWQDHTAGEDTIIFGDKAILLEEAVVTTNSKQLALKRLQELEKKYLQGTGFAGYITMAETVDVLNDPSAHKSISLFTYIASKFHMIKMNYIWGREELLYPIRGIHGDTLIRTYYLNGTKITRDLMDGIRMEDVALIKFIPMLGMEPGLPPAVIIFLKKPGDQGYWEKEKSRGVEHKVSGYTVSRELQMPDYSMSEIKVERDTRKTLFWNPYTLVTNGIAELKFYNNDITKKILISVEGVTTNGNFVLFEKVLE